MFVFGHRLAANVPLARGWLELPADESQDGCLAAAAGAHDRDDLSARYPHRDALQDLAPIVGKMYIDELDRRSSGIESARRGQCGMRCGGGCNRHFRGEPN